MLLCQRGVTINSGKFGFPEFMSMMGLKMKQTCSEQQLMRAFKAFDKDDTGYIPSPYLTEQLTTLGDKLDRREMQELLAVCENDRQQAKYSLFVEEMFSKGK